MEKERVWTVGWVWQGKIAGENLRVTSPSLVRCYFIFLVLCVILCVFVSVLFLVVSLRHWICPPYSSDHM